MKAIYTGREGISPSLGTRPVRRIMSAPPVCVAGSASLGAALRTMVRAGRRHLVVVNRDGTCGGVLADRTIVAAWARHAAALDTTTVDAALDQGAVVVDEGISVARAARLMRGAGVDAVAVVDASLRPVGIVTGSDIVALLAG
ncbi:CBS domain-containing protein [Asanoa hainanensis]|uniref:CBS domain-containing protein n=1 Tax=Asanoa hainanensis TaxID=560556 RepID=A0A239P136_9ACTN|nr:CBS domain-containing protein [Asanoa hainanensis]SNT60841.1 CBS domain-containing protein [Asanoa hainanensis]